MHDLRADDFIYSAGLYFLPVDPAKSCPPAPAACHQHTEPSAPAGGGFFSWLARLLAFKPFYSAVSVAPDDHGPRPLRRPADYDMEAAGPTGAPYVYDDDDDAMEADERGGEEDADTTRGSTAAAETYRPRAAATGFTGDDGAPTATPAAGGADDDDRPKATLRTKPLKLASEMGQDGYIDDDDDQLELDLPWYLQMFAPTEVQIKQEIALHRSGCYSGLGYRSMGIHGGWRF